MPDTSDLKELSEDDKLRESYSLLKKKISLSHELIQKYNDAVMETDRVKKELSISRKEFAKVTLNNNANMAKNIELQLENNKLKATVETLKKDLANVNIKVNADKKHVQLLNDKLKQQESKLECFKIEESLKQKELTDTIAEMKKQIKMPKEKKSFMESSSQTVQKRYRDVGTITEGTKIETCSTNFKEDHVFEEKKLFFCQECTREINSMLCSLCELEQKLNHGLLLPITDIIAEETLEMEKTIVREDITVLTPIIDTREETLEIKQTVVTEDLRVPTPIIETREEQNDISCEMNKTKTEKEDLHTLIQEMQRKIDLMEKKQRKILKKNKSINHSCCHQNSPNMSQSFVSSPANLTPANFSFMSDFCSSMFEGFKHHMVRTKRKRKTSPIVKINKVSSKRAKLSAAKWIESPVSDCADSSEENLDQPSPAISKTTVLEVSRSETESVVVSKSVEDEKWTEISSQVDEDLTKRLMEDFAKDQNCASTPRSVTKSPVKVIEPTPAESNKKLDQVEEQNTGVETVLHQEKFKIVQQEKAEVLRCPASVLPEEEMNVDILQEPPTSNSIKKLDQVEEQNTGVETVLHQEKFKIVQQEKAEVLRCPASVLPEEEMNVDILQEPPTSNSISQMKLKEEVFDHGEKELQTKQENLIENHTENHIEKEIESDLEKNTENSLAIEERSVSEPTPIADPRPQPSEISKTEQLKKSPTPQPLEIPETELNEIQLKKSPVNSVEDEPELENGHLSPLPSQMKFTDLFGDEGDSDKVQSHVEVDSRSESSHSDSENESANKLECTENRTGNDLDSPQSPDCNGEMDSPQSPDSNGEFDSPQSPDGLEPEELPITRRVQSVYPVFDDSSQTESEIFEPEQSEQPEPSEPSEPSLKVRLAASFINFQKGGSTDNKEVKGRNERATAKRTIDRKKSILTKLRKLKKTPAIVPLTPRSDPVPCELPKHPILPEITDYKEEKKPRIAHSKDPKIAQMETTVSQIKKPHIAILSVETIPKKTAIKLVKNKTDNPVKRTTSPALVSTILKDMEQSFKDVPKTQKKRVDLRSMYSIKDASTAAPNLTDKTDSNYGETVTERAEGKLVEKIVEQSTSCIQTRSKADKNVSRPSKDLPEAVKKVASPVKKVVIPAKKPETVRKPPSAKKSKKTDPLAESYSDMISNESFGVSNEVECSKELRTRKVPVKTKEAFTNGIPNSMRKRFPDPNIEKGAVPSISWMLNNYFLDEFKTPRGLRKRAPIEWRKIKYAEGQIKRLIDDQEWSMTVHTSVIENLIEHCTCDFIVNGILNYICSIEIEEEKDLTFTPPAPIMTKTQQKIVTLINSLEPHFPNIFKETQAAIEFTLFRLNCAPSNDKIELLAVLYVALARIKKDRAKVRMFCVDALYCYNLKAIVVIHCALRNWAEVLPTYGTMDDKLATCIMMIIMNMTSPCGSYPKLKNLKQLITLHYQYPTSGITSADFVKECFVDLLEHPEKHTAVNTALILLAKKESFEWTYKNIIAGGLLQSIINKTHPSTYAAYDLLGSILRSFPTTDSDKVVRDIIDQLCDLLDAAEGPHHEQESIARALLSLSRHNFYKVAKSILKWKPTKELRPDTVEKLECFFHSHPMERWRIFILNDFVPYRKKQVNLRNAAKI